MKRLLLAILVAAPAFPQGAPVTINNFPTAQPTEIFKYDGSSNLITVCYTKPFGPWNNNSVPATFAWSVPASSLTSIVVSSNTATATTAANHGLQIGNLVTVTGSTT